MVVLVWFRGKNPRQFKALAQALLPQPTRRFAIPRPRFPWPLTVSPRSQTPIWERTWERTSAVPRSLCFLLSAPEKEQSQRMSEAPLLRLTEVVVQLRHHLENVVPKAPANP